MVCSLVEVLLPLGRFLIVSQLTFYDEATLRIALHQPNRPVRRTRTRHGIRLLTLILIMRYEGRQRLLHLHLPYGQLFSGVVRLIGLLVCVTVFGHAVLILADVVLISRGLVLLLA